MTSPETKVMPKIPSLEGVTERAARQMTIDDHHQQAVAATISRPKDTAATRRPFLDEVIDVW